MPVVLESGRSCSRPRAFVAPHIVTSRVHRERRRFAMRCVNHNDIALHLFRGDRFLASVTTDAFPFSAEKLMLFLTRQLPVVNLCTNPRFECFLIHIALVSRTGLNPETAANHSPISRLDVTTPQRYSRRPVRTSGFRPEGPSIM